jgi:hypothetical protein
MWKFLCESVEGTSHLQSAGGCQDSALVRLHKSETEEVLILACADGAGSASHAAVGSKLACETIIQEVAVFFDADGRMDKIDAALIQSWLANVHAALQSQAQGLSISIRELASTFLFSVIGPASAAFAQIGDGAIVILEDGHYRPVFWPQNGDYPNTTFFITEPEFKDHLQLDFLTRPVDELSMFSDGMQMLALNYNARSAHDPFFVPLFKALRGGNPDDLHSPMREFLNSKPINDRTDDDKTLILATRIANGADATV